MLDERFIYLGAAFNLVAGIGYLIAVLRGRAQPHRITWLVWALASWIAFAGQLVEGVVLPAVMTAVVAVGATLILAASLVPRGNAWRITRLDWAWPRVAAAMAVAPMRASDAAAEDNRRREALCFAAAFAATWYTFDPCQPGQRHHVAAQYLAPGSPPPRGHALLQTLQGRQEVRHVFPGAVSSRAGGGPGLTVELRLIVIRYPRPARAPRATSRSDGELHRWRLWVTVLPHDGHLVIDPAVGWVEDDLDATSADNDSDSSAGGQRAGSPRAPDTHAAGLVVTAASPSLRGPLVGSVPLAAASQNGQVNGHA